MANILISLVGDQAVPNIFLIRDPAFRMINQYIFVTTPLMEERGRLDHIIASTGLPPAACRRVSVEADNLEAIREQLNCLQLPTQGNHYYVNLTSGTKVMSIALHAYFTQPAYRHCCSIFYVPIGKNAFLQMFPEKQAREQPLTYRISLEEYLASYGIVAAEQKGSGSLHRPEAYTEAVMPHFLSVMDSQNFWRPMKNLRDTYNRSRQKPGLEVAVERELQGFLQEIGYPVSPNGKLTKGDIAYLTGGWFEEWAFNRLRRRLGLPEEAIRFGVRVERQNPEGQAVPNECDILFTLNNTLHIVECKTGLGTRPKQLFEDALYKLTALRNEFGQRVQTLFFTLSGLRKSPRQWENTYLSRARLHRVLLLDRHALIEELDNLLERLPQRQVFGG